MRWNAWKTAAVLTLLAALTVGAYAVTTGEARLVLVLFVPVFYGTGGLGALSVLLVMSAFALWVIGTFKSLTHTSPSHEWAPPGHAPGRDWQESNTTDAGDAWPRSGDPDHESTHKRRVRGGGVIMLGPIPIILGSDKRFTLWLVLAAIALTLTALAFILLTNRGS